MSQDQELWLAMASKGESMTVIAVGRGWACRCSSLIHHRYLATRTDSELISAKFQYCQDEEEAGGQGWILRGDQGAMAPKPWDYNITSSVNSHAHAHIPKLTHAHRLCVCVNVCVRACVCVCDTHTKVCTYTNTYMHMHTLIRT